MNLNEITIKKLDMQTETLVGTYSVCFDKMLHLDGFRVYYSSARHQYSIAFPANFTVDSPKIREQIVKTVLNQIDKEIIKNKVHPYRLNDDKNTTK